MGFCHALRLLHRLSSMVRRRWAFGVRRWVSFSCRFRRLARSAAISDAVFALESLWPFVWKLVSRWPRPNIFLICLSLCKTSGLAWMNYILLCCIHCIAFGATLMF